jgi:hypothetical protein
MDLDEISLKHCPKIRKKKELTAGASIFLVALQRIRKESHEMTRWICLIKHGKEDFTLSFKFKMQNKIIKARPNCLIDCLTVCTSGRFFILDSLCAFLFFFLFSFYYSLPLTDKNKHI